MSYTRDEGSWPEIKGKPYQTQKVQYVVCLNTLGQDREFTPEEIKYALDCTKQYRDEWENIEKANLDRDIERKLDNMEAEKIYRDSYAALDDAEAEKRADDSNVVSDGGEPS